MLEPPDPLVWEQRDAMRLRCEECGETVNASVADLHPCV
jgi:hypothetical protein